MFKRGDKVNVEGFQGRKAVLYVWDHREAGVFLCTEEGFQSKMRGGEAPVIGFPRHDIKGLFQGDGEETPT